MRPHIRWSWAALAAAVVVAGLGCSGDGKVSVNGVVTLDGQPVEGAIVTFLPTDPKKSTPAFGTTGKDGAFWLTTTKTNDGAFPGEYKVTVVYMEGPVAPESGNMKDAFEGLQKAKSQKPKSPPKYNIPAKYGDPAKTDLKQTVPTGGTVTLALKSS